MAIIQGTSKSSAAAGYSIDQSIRFNDNDSAYLEKTFASAGDRQIWTWSAWIKLSGSTARQIIFGSATGPSYISINENATGSAFFNLYNAGWYWETAAKYRDPSAWYHLVWAFDTTNATADSRMRFYVNGSEVTDYSTKHTTGSQNASGGINNNVVHRIGRHPASTNYYDGYLAEINFVGGQQLDPTSFGETNADTGQWVPKKYTGSYGTNGFYITGADSADLGADDSGNGNDWTTSGLTADDQTLDTPTPDSESGVGNFNAMSPLIPLANVTGAVLSEGNTKITHSPASYKGYASNFPIPTSGKWGFQATLGPSGLGTGGQYWGIGTDSAGNPVPTNSIGVPSYWYTAVVISSADGNIYVRNSGGSQTTHYNGPLLSEGTVVELLVDMDAGTVDTKVNGSAFGPQYTGMATDLQLWPYASMYASYIQFDFGQNGYTPSDSDYKALATQNFPDPTIADPSAYFQTTLYTGDGSSSHEINQTGNSTFEPSMVWIKSRSAATDHVIQDQVRGNFVLFPNLANAQGATGGGWVKSFDSDGFTTDVNAQINASGATFAAWQWKAAGSGSSNTDGSITSTVSANTTSGFSIVSYTGTGSAATVGHGLGAAPKMIIIKDISTAESWIVYHEAVGNDGNLYLNLTNAKATQAIFNNTSPTSSVFSLGSTDGANKSGSNHVAYCFGEVDGFSKFGSYTGSGSSDGVFIYTGFEVGFLMYKRINAAESWEMYDNTRGFNVHKFNLRANLSNTEQSDVRVDLLSNGFKARSSNTAINASGSTYIYMAFGSPFKTSTAQ